MWSVASGELVYELPVASIATAQFSPDGRHLITSNGAENCIWDAESGRRLHRIPRDTPAIPGVIVYSPDQTILALSDQRWTVQLYESATMKLLGNFTAPGALHISAFGVAFTPDSTRLITSSEIAPTLNIWDLRAVRVQLAAMNLDWDLPPYPPAAPLEPVKPLHVVVELGESAP